jgi:uncharacterized protein YjbI with pentapeptide repeats
MSEATEPSQFMTPSDGQGTPLLENTSNNRSKAIAKPVIGRIRFSVKGLRDWLQLLVTIAIPIVVVFASTSLSHDQQIAQQQQKTSLQISQDQQAQDTLQTYLDRMSELVLNKDLSTSKVDQALARARTLAALQRLDPIRKGILLQFLHESGLINKNRPIVDLSFADLNDTILTEANLTDDKLRAVNLNKATLTYADLFNTNLSDAFLNGTNLSTASLVGTDLSGSHGAHLEGANLSGAFLIGATLKGADLRNANLSGADLEGTKLIQLINLYFPNLTDSDKSLTIRLLNSIYVGKTDLSGADLSGANLRGAEVSNEQLAKAKSLQGTIMPDGSKHP